jgi:predicted nucleic acid-binding protein
MNLVDSCGWLEYFANGPNAAFFAPAIEAVEELLVPTVCVYEVFKRMYQQRGRYYARKALAGLRKGELVGLDLAISLSAARLAMRHPMPLADSIILATGRACGATIWTQDAHFKSLAGVRYKAKH